MPVNSGLNSNPAQKQTFWGKWLTLLKVLYSLLVLHFFFLLIDFLRYRNWDDAYSEGTMHKLDLTFVLFLSFYFVIGVGAIIRKLYFGALITVACLVVHAFVPTLNSSDKELYGLLTNIGLIGFLLLLIVMTTLKARKYGA
ncbi:hypothetical protein SAMN05444008_119100 [Cnuella takakiae]|uniref:Uncharacterized protein n=1 Tax=Cnuella takakiae TaxID=1302690 RepID=A0A1M5HL25_9BACT|nr:hypothetical protein [Cnuella takakiae]OLY92909.1 hypothetical protein BUE76_14185 [Cnuella takakiae]SHG16630.1 hypothetical protein SAMN05444008_119100 [Cnuella takakiae]